MQAVEGTVGCAPGSRYEKRRMRASLRAAPLILGLAACSETGSGFPFEPPATVVLVEPSQFLGSVPCLDAPGAMRRYVATLYDVTAPPGSPGLQGGIALPSSAPAPCHLGVRFSLVTPGRRYTAEIDAYDRDDLRPFTPGGRVMEDASGQLIAPRWTSSCAGGASPDVRYFADGGIAHPDAGEGEPEAPSGRDLTIAVLALEQRTVPMRACAPLQDHGAAEGPTGLLVDLGTALVEKSCGYDPGRIASFTVTLRETGIRREGPCEEPLVFTELSAGEAYTFDVVALECDGRDAGGPSDAGLGRRWVTACHGFAVAGVVRRAACDPLRPAAP
jgi:hypothetical protein